MAIIAQTDKTISDGNCYPLGTGLTEDGVNFALYTKTHAQSPQKHRSIISEMTTAAEESAAKWKTLRSPES
jgi:hypothetical protein